MGLAGGAVASASAQAVCMMTGLLASVTSPDEARLALDSGADIIDCKDPSRGALGALPLPVIRDILGAVGGRRPVSATVGDLPARSETLVPAIRRIGSTGVEIVKLGLFHSTGISSLIAGLEPMAAQHRLIAVLFADRNPRLEILPDLAAGGFSGVMLDTATKGTGCLLDWMPVDQLRTFVDEARDCNLLCGLAGSLRVAQIAGLLALRADYLGFRGALCGGDRTGILDPDACARVRRQIPRDRTIGGGAEAA